jgi:hypothetical protein
MIRKLLFLVSVISSVHVQSQCTPDLSCLATGATSGYCPQSELDTGTVGVPYSDVVSVRVPEDGSDFGQPLTTILHLDIVSVDSLAPGLTYSCNPSGCSFPGGTDGCIKVFGTPTTAWDHKMTVHAMAYVRIIFVNTSQPQTLSGFYSVVLNPSGVLSLENEHFEVSQNSPNPFNSSTEVIVSSDVPKKLQMKVFDLFGKLIMEKELDIQQGNNRVSIDAEQLSPGVYMYSLGNDKESAVRRMVVSSK